MKSIILLAASILLAATAYAGAPAPKYNYLKDRRPDMYAPLVFPEANFMPGGWTYPKYKDGQEIGRK